MTPKKASQHAIPAHDLCVTRDGQEQMVMYSAPSAMDLLANTLPYVLAAKDNDGLRAWLLYYARTCS
jgi:hypothetical protein